MTKNTICLWYNNEAVEAANFYTATFPDSKILGIHHAPADHPTCKGSDILTVDFIVAGIPCMGINGGPTFTHSEAFSFQISTDSQEETDSYWNSIINNGGQASQCGWCKDRWGISWQITPRFLLESLAAGGNTARRAFTAMLSMSKIDIEVLKSAVLID